MADLISSAEAGASAPAFGSNTTSGPIPIGTSFKHEHLQAILADGLHNGFFEVHAENYMGNGGPPHKVLAAIRREYPLSIHGVGMSIGGPDALDDTHLKRFRELVDRYEPELVSEHLAWSSHAGVFYNDLLPLPYTAETLAHVCSHIDQVQETIRRPLLLENPATYVAFAMSAMSELDFIREIARRTGCGLLLDVNNVLVSTTNHGTSASEYLDAFPIEHVCEIHLAGNSVQIVDSGCPLLIDSHDRAVSPEVWALYQRVIGHAGAAPTLIEWDSNLPDWQTLRAQALCARALIEAVPNTRPKVGGYVG